MEGRLVGAKGVSLRVAEEGNIRGWWRESVKLQASGERAYVVGEREASSRHSGFGVRRLGSRGG
jgi:hypothetical protein